MTLSQGLAPFTPSFIVNQGDAHKKIKQIIQEFFAKQLGLEYEVLVSYIGDGKTHTLHSVYSHYDNIENVFVGKVYLRDKYSDIIQDILRTIKRSKLREFICDIVNKNIDKSAKRACNIVSSILIEKMGIDLQLAKLMYYVAYGSVEESIEALNFLSAQSNVLESLKRKVGKIVDYEEIYFKLLEVICDYFYKNNYFLIVLFDELEHVFDRTERMKRTFFRNLKQLIDYSEKYKNLLILFANTEAFKGEFNKMINDNLKIIDPALQDRLNGVLIPLKSLSSEQEAMQLIDKLKLRYNRIYPNVNIDSKKVYYILINKKLTASEPSYRTSCQKIIEIFNDIKESNIQKYSNIDNTINNNGNSTNNEIDNKKDQVKENLLISWKKDNSLTKKKKFITCFEEIFKNTNIKTSDVKKKKGYILAKGYNKDTGRGYRNDRLYFFVYSDSKDDGSLIRKKLKEAEKLQIDLKLTTKEIYFIYYKDICPSNIEEQLNKINPGVLIPISVEKAELLELLMLLNEDNTVISQDDKKELAYSYAKKFGIL